MGSFVVGFEGHVCVDPGLIYSQVDNFPLLEIKGGKTHRGPPSSVKPCERTCFVQHLFVLLKLLKWRASHHAAFIYFLQRLGIMSWSPPVLPLSVVSGGEA